MRKKAFAFWLGLWAALPLLAGPAASAEEINFGFAWIPYGKHAFFYGAREKGFYAKEGFSSVKFVPGRGGMDAIKKIAAGQTDFGLGGIDVLVVARAKGTKVKALGVWHDKGFLVVYYLKDSGIKVPQRPGRPLHRRARLARFPRPLSGSGPRRPAWTPRKSGGSRCPLPPRARV